MTEIIKTLTLDLARKNNTRLVFAVQNDYLSRKVIINLTNDGEPYLLDSNTSAIVGILCPSQESRGYSAQVIDGAVSFTIPLWALSEAGEVKCTLSLFDSDGKKLSASSFLLDVEATAYIGDELSEDSNYSLLEGLMQDISGIIGVEMLRVEAENQRALAEMARQSAEEEREAAENAMGIAEANRQSNESQRQVSENQRELSEGSREAAELNRSAGEVLREQAEQERQTNEETRNELFEQKLLILEDAYGKIGNLTLAAAQFSIGNGEYAQNVFVNGLRENDMITLVPSSRLDKEIAEDAKLFVTPECEEGILEFSVKTLPTNDINLIYFITRGEA